MGGTPRRTGSAREQQDKCPTPIYKGRREGVQPPPPHPLPSIPPPLFKLCISSASMEVNPPPPPHCRRVGDCASLMPCHIVEDLPPAFGLIHELLIKV